MPPHMGSYLVDQLICICIFNCGDHPCGAVDIFFSDFKLYCQKKIGQIFRNIRAMNIKIVLKKQEGRKTESNLKKSVCFKPLCPLAQNS